MSEADTTTTTAVAEPPPQVFTEAEDFGLDHADTPEEVSQPQAPNAAEEAGDGAEVEQAKGEEAKAAAEGDKATEGAEVEEPKPQTDEGKETQEAAAARRSFWDYYLSPDPIRQTLDHMKGRSEARYEELKAEVVAEELSDADAFAEGYYGRDKDGFGRLAKAFFHGHPEFYTKELTGREDLTREQILTAVNFYERNKDKVKDESPGLSPEKMAELRQWLPELADEVEALVKQSAGQEKAESEKAEAKAEPGREAAKAEAPKTEQPTLTPEQQQRFNETFDPAYKELDSYLTRYADDAEGLALAVTEQERTLAPDVAEFKDLKRKYLFEGKGSDLPTFEEGLLAWAKGNAQFKKAFERLVYFSEKGEAENAKEAARALIPFAEAYRAERLKHPIFKWVDSKLADAAKSTNPPQHSETLTPGSQPNVSQPSATPEARRYQEAENFGL